MLLPLLLSACTRADVQDDSGPPEAWAPDLDLRGEGPVLAGAAAVSITPPCFESFVDLDGDAEFDKDEELLDCGCDRLCPDDEGYPGADEGEGDGKHQAVWMAGFQNNRPAQGVHDDLWARALVLEQGELRIGIVAVDLIGWFNQEAIDTREAAAHLDLDHVLVVATHTHEGPDTIGMWGKSESGTGFDRGYGDFVVERSVQALEEAVADLRELGELKVGAVDVRDYSPKGALNLVSDRRDPKVIDPALSAALLTDTQGQVIASLAHFGNHPEAMADENGLLTSDYVYGLRQTMEEELGGTALFLTGTVGGMMTPLGVTFTDADGVEWRDYTHERAYKIGEAKGRMAVDAIAGGEVIDPSLQVVTTSFYLPVENYAFQAGFLSGVLGRETYLWDPNENATPENLPHVRTEMNFIAIGSLHMLSFPGEVFPELAVGGYDGSLTGSPEIPVNDPGNPNPPDLSLAPEGPYWKDLLQTEHAWLIGMGNDELGYIIPPFQFELDPYLPWFDEAEGDHYEETNSLGPSIAPLLDAEAKRLTEWAYSH